jgi:hypothetical protein
MLWFGEKFGDDRMDKSRDQCSTRSGDDSHVLDLDVVAQSDCVRYMLC